jgi:hypothetical protein
MDLLLLWSESGKMEQIWVLSQPLIQLIMNHISQARMKVIDYYHLDVSRDDEFVQGWKFFEWELLFGRSGF